MHMRTLIILFGFLSHYTVNGKLQLISYQMTISCRMSIFSKILQISFHNIGIAPMTRIISILTLDFRVRFSLRSFENLDERTLSRSRNTFRFSRQRLFRKISRSNFHSLNITIIGSYIRYLKSNLTMVECLDYLNNIC